MRAVLSALRKLGAATFEAHLAVSSLAFCAYRAPMIDEQAPIRMRAVATRARPPLPREKRLNLNGLSGSREPPRVKHTQRA